MFNILLIDCEKERGETLKQRIERCNCQVEHELQIGCFTPEKIRNANWELMILHRSSRNSGGEKFADDNFLSGRKPVIYYGGKGVRSDSRYEEFINGGTAYFHLSPITTGKEEDFYIEDWLKKLNKASTGLTSVPSFAILKHGSHGARIVNAHRLRYNILTPFVALHLSLQAYREDDNEDALMIDEIKNPENYRTRENAVNKLLSLSNADGNSIIDGESDAYHDHFENLFSDPALTKLFRDLEYGKLPEKNDANLKTVISNIEVLAHNMEQAVSFIEFGDEPDWRMFV